MTLHSVLEQYAKHLQRLANKKPSKNRDKGIAYYTAAAERVQALINAPNPEWAGATGKFTRL